MSTKTKYSTHPEPRNRCSTKIKSRNFFYKNQKRKFSAHPPETLAFFTFSHLKSHSVRTFVVLTTTAFTFIAIRFSPTQPPQLPFFPACSCFIAILLLRFTLRPDRSRYRDPAKINFQKILWRDVEVNFEAKRGERVGIWEKSSNHHRSQCHHDSSRPSHELDHTSIHAHKAIETPINAHDRCQRADTTRHRCEETACFGPCEPSPALRGHHAHSCEGVASDFWDFHGHRPCQLHWPSIDSMAEGWHRDLTCNDLVT